jgi:hypothetical protein
MFDKTPAADFSAIEALANVFRRVKAERDSGPVCRGFVEDEKHNPQDL